MADVDKICRGVLDAKALGMSPHPITTASGRRVVTLLVNVKALVKHISEDRTTAHLQVSRGSSGRPPFALTRRRCSVFAGVLHPGEGTGDQRYRFCRRRAPLRLHAHS